MQTAFFLISGILPKEEALAAIKEQITATYGAKGPRVVDMNYAAAERALERLVEVPLPPAATSTRRMRPAVPADAPAVRAHRHGPHDRGRGGSAPRLGAPPRRHLADRDHAVREAQHRRPDPGLGAGDLHPVRPVLLRLPPRDDPDQGLRPGARWRRRRRPSSTIGANGQALAGLHFTVQVAPEDCTGCGQCVDICPAHGRGRRGGEGPGVQGDQHAPAGAAPRVRGREPAVLPGAARNRPGALRRAHRQGQPARPAALRVPRRLRRLRRDPLHPAADAALRRPAADRQRHRLLLDLRRQPSHDALHEARGRARPGLVELALRGQRGVRPRHAPGGGPLPHPGAGGARSARRGRRFHRAG